MPSDWSFAPPELFRWQLPALSKVWSYTIALAPLPMFKNGMDNSSHKTWQQMASPRGSDGCACGSIRYQLLDKPMLVHCCHCDDCQRLTGSAFVLNAIIETQAIKLLRGNPVA